MRVGGGEFGEEPPQHDDEPIRLAQLGLLRDDELAARAAEARTRIGTPAEHVSGDGRYRPDVLAVELHEAVTAGACPNSAKKTGILWLGRAQMRGGASHVEAQASCTAASSLRSAPRMIRETCI